MRSPLQWPELYDHMDAVFNAIRHAFEAPNGGTREARMVAYPVRLKALHPEPNSYFYDVDPALIRALSRRAHSPNSPGDTR